MISHLVWNAEIRSWDHFGDPETPQERPKEPQHPPETLQDTPGTPQGPPGTLPGHPGPPPILPGSSQGTPRDAQGSPEDPPETPRAPARGQKSSQRVPRDAQVTKNEPQATQKEAKHPRASYPQVFLSVSSFPSAQFFGEGGNTPTPVTPTHLLVSLQLSLCSSLWGRVQNTHARHIRKSSCQFPAFPLLESLSKGATHPRESDQQVFLSTSCAPPCSIHPAKNPWMRRSHAESPMIYIYIHIYILYSHGKQVYLQVASPFNVQ